MSWAKGILDEMRYQDKIYLANQDKIDRRLDAFIPQVRADQAKRKAVDDNAKNAVKFFKNRVDHLEGNEKLAFFNNVKKNPVKALKVYQEIIEAEKREGYAKVTGDKLIDFYDFIEETIPEGMTRDEWIEKSATIVTTPGLSRDELLIKLADPDIDLTDLKKLQREYTPYIIPTSAAEDFNFEALDVLSQTFITQATNNIVNSATAQASLRLTELTSEAASGSLNEAQEREKIDLENLFTTIENDGELAILNTGYGAAAFLSQAEADKRVTKIPGFLETFNDFYDEDGNYVGIQ
jgi:hypothetical protein